VRSVLHERQHVFRKIIAGLLALPLITSGISVANAAVVPYTQNFESMVTYNGVDFDGGVGTLVTDQPAGEGFTSGTALKVETKEAAWAGTKLILPATSSFISNANKTGTISVYSPDAEDRCFVLKLEGGGAIERSLRVVQGWQTLTYNYSMNYNPAVNYNVLVFMPDFKGIGCATDSGSKPLTTWYVDNISFPGFRDSAEVIVAEERSNPSTLLNFEPDDTSGYELVDFNGASSSVVTDAPADGSIGSTKALKVITTGNTAGTVLVSKSRAASLISASSFVVKANIYSPVSGKIIMLKIESIDHPSQVVEIRQNSVAGWKTYSFNFEVGGNLTQDYPRAIIFFDFLGDGASNPWYLDDLAFNGAVGASIPGGGGGGGGGNAGAGEPTPTLLTFEGDDSLGVLNTTEAVADKPQGFFGGANAVITEAPAGGLGGNVLAITKSGAPWAGINALVSLDGSFRYSDATNTKVTFNYYSPKGGSPVGLEMYNGATLAVSMTQTANAGWNNIEFDLSTSSGWSSLVKYDKLVIFPDFQVEAANEVFYLDNLAVNGATTPQITIVPEEPVVVAPKVKPTVRKSATVSTKTPKVGVTLTANKGAYNGSATITYKYTWYRCSVLGKTALKTKPAASAKCSVISGKTSSSLKLSKSDKGKYIRVMVTAKNSKGYVYNMSKSTTKKVK
jgi:hypothetical protein